MKKASIAFWVVVAASAVLAACGSYKAGTGSTSAPSGLKFRVFVSNPLLPSSVGTGTPVLNIVDALKDLISTSAVSVASASPSPGLMVLFPNKRFTLVFSATTTTNSLAEINNATESVVSSSSGTTASLALAGFSESIIVGPDNATGFAAVPSASVSGESPGAIQVLDLSTQTTTAMLPVPGAQFVVQSHNGNRLLAFGNLCETGTPPCSDTVTVIAPALIGTTTDPRTFIPSSNFDHPVWGVFSSDDNTAYILNCGPECGGTEASITPLDMNSNVAGSPIPVEAATIGLLSGGTLYVAGTKPPSPPGTNTCAAATTATLATTCGVLSVVDIGSGSIASSAVITDGYHNRMEMGANGQLFIGAHNCTNITSQNNNNTGEIRGCLSIFNTGNSSVVVPPQNGDATGIQPITGRSVVYVVQNGQLRIYDTTNDKLQVTQVSIVGKAVDAKLVD